MSSVCQMLAVHPCDREPMDPSGRESRVVHPLWPRAYEGDAHGRPQAR